jgi:hypothetical protein
MAGHDGEYERVLGRVRGPLSVEMWHLVDADRRRWEALAGRTGWAAQAGSSMIWRRNLPGTWEVTWQPTPDSGNLLGVRVLPPEHPLVWRHQLIDLLRCLGRALERQVVLVDEGCDGVPLLRYDPGTDRVAVAPQPVATPLPRPAYELCCPTMSRQFTEACTSCPDPYRCPDTLVVYDPASDTYGLPIKDGGSARSQIARCPWCGASLPPPR